METALQRVSSPSRLTWSEIKRNYPDQWVVLGGLDADPVTLEIHSAVVRGWGSNGGEAQLMAGVQPGETVARLWTGKLGNPRPW